ncbi:hypothetical protein [Hoeflea marina]|uniref:hypothetical protein n=1 Tax=Hoeflea marina TaxID=274592 RepID=UPI001304F08D|nr:hypothetical protein [Hoeflea marina]
MIVKSIPVTDRGAASMRQEGYLAPQSAARCMFEYRISGLLMVSTIFDVQSGSSQGQTP